MTSLNTAELVRTANNKLEQYASASSDNLKLAGSGTGDIAEMTETLQDDEAAYAYVRMKLGNDEYSERVKFAFVVWQGKQTTYFCLEHISVKSLCVRIMTYRTGPQTKVMRKAKMSFQSGQVKQVIRSYAIEVQTGDKKDLDEEAVTLKLRKAMGANCKYRRMGWKLGGVLMMLLDDRQGSSY